MFCRPHAKLAFAIEGERQQRRTHREIKYVRDPNKLHGIHF